MLSHLRLGPSTISRSLKQATRVLDLAPTPTVEVTLHSPAREDWTLRCHIASGPSPVFGTTTLVPSTEVRRATGLMRRLRQLARFLLTCSRRTLPRTSLRERRIPIAHDYAVKHGWEKKRRSGGSGVRRLHVPVRCRLRPPASPVPVLSPSRTRTRAAAHATRGADSHPVERMRLLLRPRICIRAQGLRRCATQVTPRGTSQGTVAALQAPVTRRPASCPVVLPLTVARCRRLRLPSVRAS
ncbi:hypothetical protein B0H10DRAFT_19420 [Mycena sp. CBHHK59/15]|nr:hypothetical protein B0H10DRAFT_19420 [Mycena sp. CBHHK59/15]